MRASTTCRFLRLPWVNGYCCSYLCLLADAGGCARERSAASPSKQHRSVRPCSAAGSHAGPHSLRLGPGRQVKRKRKKKKRRKKKKEEENKGKYWRVNGRHEERNNLAALPCPTKLCINKPKKKNKKQQGKRTRRTRKKKKKKGGGGQCKHGNKTPPMYKTSTTKTEGYDLGMVCFH